jgi:glutaredoxin
MSIEIYGQPNCRFCISAQELCAKTGLAYSYHDISADALRKDEFLARTKGAKTVPQIFVAGTLIGGFTEFNTAVQNGTVQQMLGGQ